VEPFAAGPMLILGSLSVRSGNYPALIEAAAVLGGINLQHSSELSSVIKHDFALGVGACYDASHVWPFLQLCHGPPGFLACACRLKEEERNGVVVVYYPLQ